MNKTIVLILFFLTANCNAQNLQFFDREMIVKHNIKEIWEQVASAEKGTDDWVLCPNYYYVFDKKGNIIGSGVGRVSTTVGYKYNENNEVIDIYWKERSTGKIEHYFSSNENNIKYPEQFKQELKETEVRLVLMLSDKQSYNNHPEIKVSDSCSMINAEYILSVSEEENGLPISFIANFKAELKTSPTPEKPASPKKLFINYVYKFHNKSVD